MERQAFNTVMVRTHLEYEERFIGTIGSERPNYIVSDSGADTYIIGGQGWVILDTDPVRTTNLVAFDANKMRKPNCPIVTTMTKIKTQTGEEILWIVRDMVFNEGGAISLASEYQSREYGIAIDSRHKHPDSSCGTQSMYLLDDDDTIIPMEVRGALAMYQHWEPSNDDVEKLKRHFATAIGPWEPHQYYNRKPTMDIMGSEWMSFHAAREKEQPSGATHIAVDNGAKKHPLTKIVIDHNQSVINTPPSETPNEPFFIDALQYEGEDENPLLYVDAKEQMKPRECLGKAFHLSIDFSSFICDPDVDTFLDHLDHDELMGHNEPFDTLAFAIRAKATIPEAEVLQPYLAWRPLEVVQCTLENTTQLARLRMRAPLHDHTKPWYPWLNRPRLHETVAMDTMFASLKAIGGHHCAQVYWGFLSHYINMYGMKTESDSPRTLDDFTQEEGILPILRSDNSKMQRWGIGWLKRMHDWLCQPEFTTLHNPQQNPAEMRAIKWLKDNNHILHAQTGAPNYTWLLACQYLADIHNITADETLEWKTPWEKCKMETPDISTYLQFKCWECVYYLDPGGKFPSTKQQAARWVGIMHNVGDALTFKLITEDTEQEIERGVVLPASYVHDKTVHWDPNLDNTTEDNVTFPPQPQ